MKRLLNYILPIFILALTSCHSTIHEHPDAGDALVTLTMNVKTAGPEIYSVIEYTNESRVIFSAKDYRFPNSRSDIRATLSQHLAKTAVDTEHSFNVIPLSLTLIKRSPITLFNSVRHQDDIHFWLGAISPLKGLLTTITTIPII